MITYSLEPSITLKMIIDGGILHAGIKLYTPSNDKVFGTLNLDGSITLEINNDLKKFYSPSGAARAIEKKNLNGWIYWRVRESNTYQDLRYFRNKYIEFLNSKTI